MSPPISLVRVLGVLLVLLAWPAHGRGQAGAGALRGEVADVSGARLPGTTVTVSEQADGAERTTAANAEGQYTVGALPPGTYQVRAQMPGYRTAVRDHVHVETGETIRVDLRLEPGDVSDTVVVRVEAPVLRDQSSGLGHVIDNRSVLGLPLNGRSFITLAALAPGVAMPAPPAAPLPRINGGRPRTNEYLFDGISVLQPEPGQVAFFPNIDAIQEFRIESNSPPAEFGRFNGGVVNLTTRAGGNQVQGSLFSFVRNEALNARNLFAPPGTKPRFRRQQSGGVVGGPLRRDRTFFFADYQGQRQEIGRTVISTVPTLLQRQGVFTELVAGQLPRIYDPGRPLSLLEGATRQPFPNNTLPADRMDPVARALVARYPLPTSPGTANNYQRVGNEVVNQDQFSGRIDHRPTGRDQLFARLTRFRETLTPVAPLPDGSGASPGARGPQQTTAWSLATNHRRTFASSVLHELRVGDTRRHVVRGAADLGVPAGAALNLAGIPSDGRFATTLPTFLIGGYQHLGSPPNTATDFGTSVTEAAETVSWLHGRHTFKAGADLRWQRLDVVQPPSPTGVFTFGHLFTDLPGAPGTGAPLASFLLGQVQQFSIDLQSDEIRNRAHIQEYFVQDDWRVWNRLTINAGVRYTLNFPSTEKSDQAAVFNLGTGELEYLGRDGHPRSARALHTHNFAPRLGIVGSVDERTVARAGYGLVWIEMAGVTTPFTTPVFPFLQTVSQRSLDNVTPAFILAEGPRVEPIPFTADAGIGQGVFAVDRNRGSGYVQQWNTSLQRQLGDGLAVEFAYTGSKITRVGVPDANLNQLTAEQLARGPELLRRVPNPYFGLIPRSSSLGDPTIPLAQLLKPYPMYTTVSMYRDNVGTTIYHGAYVKLEQRLSRGLSYRVSYTRSKLVDDASSVFDASILTGPVADFPVADSFDRRRERDLSTGDLPHVFVASAVWDVPVGRHRTHPIGRMLSAVARGWTISGVVTLQSGAPLAVTQITNNNAFAGFGTQRPNLTADPELPAGARSVQRWFNTDAFSVAPAFTLGTSSRNPIRGPAFRNLDLALVRRVSVGGRRSLELRAEAFNLTNTPPLLAPNTVVGSPAFGTITAAGDPRVIQLASKFAF